MSRCSRYILDGEKPVPCPDLMKWAQWMEYDNRRVAFTTLFDEEVRISTVFLGIDHGYGLDAPVLWETMAFGGEWDGFCRRCSGTQEQAYAMHLDAVRQIKKVIVARKRVEKHRKRKS